jgi:heat shock protein HslJ
MLTDMRHLITGLLALALAGCTSMQTSMPDAAEAMPVGDYVLVAIEGDPVDSVLPESARRPTISLTPEGGVSGQSGVNRYVTSIESEQHAVNACRFDAIATSRMAGPPDAMAFEQRFLALLGQVRKLAVESDALRFESTEGDELLRFAPAADTSANE